MFFEGTEHSIPISGDGEMILLTLATFAQEEVKKRFREYEMEN